MKSKIDTKALKEVFKSPPPGYGVVPFYWWVGEELVKERLLWQLEQLAGMHISGIQINYCHTDKGGQSYGLTYRNKPDLFSEEWWELFSWFMEEAYARGMSVSLSDYTLGTPGQGYYTDRILEEHPEMRGQKLNFKELKITKGQKIKIAVSNLLCAHFIESGVDEDEGQDVLEVVQKGEFYPNTDGRLLLVYVVFPEYTFDPKHEKAGEQVIEKFFASFEEHCPEQCGKGLNFFFSDELNFNISGNLWNDAFADEFQRRKGYDIRPNLWRIFEGENAKSVKVRLDYYDVIVQLEEENYFSKIYKWHEDRGIIYGCDHGGRGYDVTEFGDYFRTQKYNQGPGCDQPYLSSDIIKNKVASSIAHLYNRPRVWLEGFHSSGWGTSTEDIADAVARNFVMGQNLLSLHGLYYTTFGGWWEWAPPCNCFRMPYWKDMKHLLGAVERLSFLLSQGVHNCDVGIIYPVAAVEGTSDGKISVDKAFECGRRLYEKGIDFDFLDFQSIEKAEIRDKKLCIAGESYSIIIIPNMKAIRFGCFEKLLKFAQEGGIVYSICQLPIYTDGDTDSLYNRFDMDRVKVISLEVLLQMPELKPQIVAEGVDKFYSCHRIIGDVHLFFTYGVPKGTPCFFPVKGEASYWDPFTGKCYRLQSTTVQNGTILNMPVSNTEFQLILFNAGEADDVWQEPPSGYILLIEGEWDFTIQPTMDNRWGDFSQPASEGYIGPQVRELRMPKENRSVICGYGEYFRKKGPFLDEDEFQKAVADAKSGNFSGFCLHEYSERFGLLDDPGHQGYHGLKGKVGNDFLTVGKPKVTPTDIVYMPEEKGFGCVYAAFVTAPETREYYILTGDMKPDILLINGQEHNIAKPKVLLKKGKNAVVIGYRKCGRTYLVFSRNAKVAQPNYPLASSWYRNRDVLPFECYEEPKVQQFEFTAPPGLHSLTVPCADPVRGFIDGKEIEGKRVGDKVILTLNSPAKGGEKVLLEVNAESGRFGGALFDGAIEQSFQTGKMNLGDWSRYDGLKYYSGSAVYEKTIWIDQEYIGGRAVLDLGGVVASASVKVNGVSVGVRTAKPWTFEIGHVLHAGENRISVRVCNTLANHYESIPTRYKGSLVSGLLGPVTIQFE